MVFVHATQISPHLSQYIFKLFNFWILHLLCVAPSLVDINNFFSLQFNSGSLQTQFNQICQSVLNSSSKIRFFFTFTYSTFLKFKPATNWCNISITSLITPRDFIITFQLFYLTSSRLRGADLKYIY